MPKWYGGRQHGDALHIGNYDPTNNNFEYFSVHEHGDFGMTLMDAKQVKKPSTFPIAMIRDVVLWQT